MNRMAAWFTAGVIGFACCLAGCGPTDNEPTAEELLRARQLRQSTQLAQGKTPQQRLHAAQQALAQGNVVAAQSELRPLLIADPDNAEVLLLMARCEAAGGDHPTALSTLAAIPADSDSATYRQSLWLAAQWLTDIRQYDAAIEKLQKLLPGDKDPDRIHRRLASLLNLQGHRLQAAEHLSALARGGNIREKELFAMNTYSDAFIDPALPKPDVNDTSEPAVLVAAMRMREDGNLRQAQQLARRLQQAQPQSTAIAAFAGRLHSELQDDQALQQWYADLPEGIEDEPGYWYAIGLWLQRRGEHPQAIRSFGEAVRRDPTHRFAYQALAGSLAILGHDDAATRVTERFELLDQAAQITRRLGQQPGTWEQLQQLADALDQLGRPWEALAWREVAVRTHLSDDDEVQLIREQRRTLTETAPSDVDDEFVLVGLQLADWPLPVRHDALISTTPTNDATAKSSDPQPLSTTQIVFTDVAAEIGLQFQYDNGDDPNDDARLLHQMTGGGIAVLDYDLDGWPDLYLTQAGGQAFDPQGSGANQCFRNLGGTALVDRSQATGTQDRGYGQGAAVADLNQDGFPDLLVANVGPNLIYLNNGDGTFAARRMPADDEAGDWTTSIACGDLNGDQLPEVVEINYVDDPKALTTFCTPTQDICNPSVFQPARNRVWTVANDGTFTPWRGGGRLGLESSYGFAAVLTNLDGRHGNDLFVANDTDFNHLWISQPASADGSHTLIESGQLFGCAAGLLGQRHGCMGIAYGDFDRNGRIDLHVTNFWNQPAELYLQQQGGLYVNGNVSHDIYEHSRRTVGWGTAAVDFDRDGWLDLAVLNGHVTDHRHLGQPLAMPGQLFQGRPGGFDLVTADPSDYWARQTQGRTMAVLDWNRDGRPDVIANHLDVPVALLQNNTATANHVIIELVGTQSERDAIGAIATVTCGDQQWTQWVAGGDGFLCSNEAVLDFGIGQATRIDQIEIQWPSGQKQQWLDLDINQRYLMIEGQKSFDPR